MGGQVISLPRKDWSDGCSETNYDSMQNGGITFIFINKETFFSCCAFFFSPSFIDLSTLAASDESKNALCYLKLKAECVWFRRQSGKVLWRWHATLSIWHVKTREEFVLSSRKVKRGSGLRRHETDRRQRTSADSSADPFLLNRWQNPARAHY